MSEVRMPDWHVGLMEAHRYKVMYGGRGSGKSWTTARCLLILAASKSLRILCTREVQESIKDSVHRLLCDQIEALGLGEYYDITEREIRGVCGSSFIFSGLAAHTVESIKSFEGVDIVWCEEAQVIQRKSWNILTPTIRRPGSEIWLTMNPMLETDETWVRFIMNAGDDTLLVPVNWRDNPWFSAENEKDRQYTLKFDPDNYQNIWEGEPLRVAEGAIYRHEVDALYKEDRVRNVPHDPVLPVHTVWDLGWNDSMSIAFVQRSASELRVVDYLENRNQTLAWYVMEINKRNFRWGKDFIPHDGAARDFKTGMSTEEMLKKMDRNVEVLPVHSVEEGIKAARLVFPRCYFDKGKTGRLLECLKRYRRIVAKNGEAMSPLHDEFSHGADCFRYIGQAVDKMSGGYRNLKPIQYSNAGIV